MELEILLDKPLEEAKELMTFQRPDGKLAIPMSKIYKPDKKVRDDQEILVTHSAAYKGYTIQELENGSIEVFEDGQKISVVKPILREIAGQISLSITNKNGNPYNTRQLGTLIIKELNHQTFIESIRGGNE